MKMNIEQVAQSQIDRYIGFGFHRELGMSEAEYDQSLSLPKGIVQPERYKGRFDHLLLIEPRIPLSRQLEIIGANVFLDINKIFNGVEIPSYPYAVWTHDGKLHLSYSLEETMIWRFKSDEVGSPLIEAVDLCIQNPRFLEKGLVAAGSIYEFNGADPGVVLRYAPSLSWGVGPNNIPLPQVSHNCDDYYGGGIFWGALSRGSQIIKLGTDETKVRETTKTIDPFKLYYDEKYYDELDGKDLITTPQERAENGAWLVLQDLGMARSMAGKSLPSNAAILIYDDLIKQYFITFAEINHQQQQGKERGRLNFEMAIGRPLIVSIEVSFDKLIESIMEKSSNSALICDEYSARQVESLPQRDSGVSFINIDEYRYNLRFKYRLGSLDVYTTALLAATDFSDWVDRRVSESGKTVPLSPPISSFFPNN